MRVRDPDRVECGTVPTLPSDGVGVADVPKVPRMLAVALAVGAAVGDGSAEGVLSDTPTEDFSLVEAAESCGVGEALRPQASSPSVNAVARHRRGSGLR